MKKKQKKFEIFKFLIKKKKDSKWPKTCSQTLFVGTYFFPNNFCLTPHLEKKKKKMKMRISIPKQATRWPKFCTKVGLIKSYHPTPTMIPCPSPCPREVDFKSRPMLKLVAPNCSKFLGDEEGTKGYHWHYPKFPRPSVKKKRFTFKF